MALDPKRVRRWFAAGALFVMAISLAYYLYGRLRVWRIAERAPSKMGVEVQQSTQGFTLSKSEGGRTIFTVHASKAVQYKQGGRAELQGVSILVYGRHSDRFDQIYGDSFEYDPNSGEIMAHGDVAIDLEGDAQGPVRPDQATPLELKNPIHLKTSGLTFNQKTGAAATREKIEFRIPQARGSAVGASYDSKSNTLTLGTQVHVETIEGATVLARHAIITQNPRRALLEATHIERRGSDIDAGRVMLYLRDDNSISRVVATGSVRGTTRGARPGRVEAGRGDFTLGPRNELQSGVLSGEVEFRQEGPSPFHGSAGRAMLAFGPKNVLRQVRAIEGARFIQEQRATANQGAQSVELASDGLDVFLAAGRLDHGVTSGAAKITVRPQTSSGSQGDTVITAGHFDMSFAADGRLRALHGEPDTRIVSSTSGQADKVSTSQTLDVTFNLGDGGISSIVQQGNVRYHDAQRSATATEARYTPGDGNLVLTGLPRWTEAGGATTAHVLKLNRRTGEAFAEGEVKTIYRETRSQPGGALLGGSEPIHVTADNMVAHRLTGTAIYSGEVRLWQGSDIVEAPVIGFDRANRVLKAKGGPQPVSTVFVQTEGTSKGKMVKVTSSSLTYSDPQRRAVFQGSVLIKSTEGTMNADGADVVLKPRGQSGGTQGTSDASQIEEILARGHVVVEQPSRKAFGNTMTYTARDGKFVLSGGRPSIFDAERGVITGDSLTFYSRSDTVLVGSEASARTITQTRTGK